MLDHAMGEWKMPQKALNLAKRYNKNGSISLIGYKGRVVFNSRDPRSIDAFVAGWYGERKVIFNRPQFAAA